MRKEIGREDEEEREEYGEENEETCSYILRKWKAGGEPNRLAMIEEGGFMMQTVILILVAILIYLAIPRARNAYLNYENPIRKAGMIKAGYLLDGLRHGGQYFYKKYRVENLRPEFKWDPAKVAAVIRELAEENNFSVSDIVSEIELEKLSKKPVEIIGSRPPG